MCALKKTREVYGVNFSDANIEAILADGEPCILKGALSKHALVIAGQESNECAMEYLQTYANDRPALCYTTVPDADGRLFYNDNKDGFNFSISQVPMRVFFESLRRESAAKSGTGLYIGSAELTDHFPELIGGSGLKLPGKAFESYIPRIGIWLGNRTTASAHYDVSNNVAACLVGKRRFTLLPPGRPEAFGLGPLEPTPGGQTISMLDVRDPDLSQFPEAKALEGIAEEAVIEAGDVLIYPSMWWHQVEALDDFNVMVNYWWNELPAYIDDPMATLLHGILSLRDRPVTEKEAWRELFDYYVFGDPAVPRKNLPDHAWGALAPMDEMISRRLRKQVMRKINR